MKTYIYYFFLALLGFSANSSMAQTFIDNTSQNSWPNPSPWVNDTMHAPKLGIVEIGAAYRVANPQIIEAGATLQIKGYLDIAGNTQLYNYGTIIVDSLGTFDCSGSATFYNYGVLIINGTLSGNGNFSLDNSGLLAGSGTINLGQNALGNFTNTGSINGCTLPGTGCFTNGAPLPGAPPTDGLNNIYYTNPGAPIPATTCADRLWVIADLTLGAGSMDVGAVVVGETLTVSSNIPGSNTSFNVCQDITNYGTVIVNNGASLFQSSATDLNTGDGLYLIRQSGGQSSNTQYNIWSSPITNALTVNDNAGSGTEVFPGTNPCDLYVVDASTQTWAYDFDPALTYTCLTNPNVNFTGFTSSDAVSDGIMDVGRGYYAVGNGFGKEFAGTVNNADITIPVYANNLPIPSGWAQANLNLVGNPYPSGLDATVFFTDNSTVLTDAIYFWDDNTDSYVAWNVSGGSAPANPNIGVAQGFWVVATSNSNVTFSNSQRSGVNNQFFKTENTSNSNVWLELGTPNGSKGNILVGYSKGATDGMDRLYDAHFMPGNDNVKLVSVINGEEFMIQSVGNLNFHEEKVVQLNVRTSETGIHTFSELKRDYIPNSVNVFLRDLETGAMHDLSKGDLSIRLKAEVDYNGRFEMVFINTALENSDDAISGVGGDAVTSVENIVSDSEYKLLNEANGYSLYNADGINGTIRVMDVTGKVMFTQTNISNTPTVRLDLNGFSGGVYIVEIIENGSRVYTTKLVK